MLGWTEERFWKATLREYDRAVRGYEIKEKNEWIKFAWMTQNIMNVCGMGLGSLRRRVTLRRLLDSIPLFAEERIQEKEKITYTRADYEEIKRKHAALHRKIYEEQQRRQSHAN
jgi:hypothetical protein